MYHLDLSTKHFLSQIDFFLLYKTCNIEIVKLSFLISAPNMYSVRLLFIIFVQIMSNEKEPRPSYY